MVFALTCNLELNASTALAELGIGPRFFLFCAEPRGRSASFMSFFKLKYKHKTCHSLPINTLPGFSPAKWVDL